MKDLHTLLENSPVIATVTDWEDVDFAVRSQTDVVLVAFGNVIDIAQIVDALHAAGKIVIAHIELIDGFSAREIAVDLLLSQCRVEGIISTKVSHIRRARQLGIVAILRTFIIDTKSFQNLQSQMLSKPDLVEIEPGIMPKVISKMCSTVPVPVIASGFITEKQEIFAAISAGAIAISTSQVELWNI